MRHKWKTPFYLLSSNTVNMDIIATKKDVKNGEINAKKKWIWYFSYNATLCWALAFTWMLLWHVPPTLPQTNYAHLSQTETWWQWFLLQDNMPHNSAKAAQEWPEEHEAQRARAKLPDLIRLKSHEMHTKSNPWRPHLATHRTQRMSATSCQTPQEIPRGTMSDWAMAERGGGHITLERCLLYCCGWFIFQTYLHNVTTPGYCLFRIWLWSMWPLFRLDAKVTRCYFSAVQSERNKTGNCDIQITYINFSFSFRNMCLYSFCKCNISLGFDNQNPSSAWMEFSPRLHPPPMLFSSYKQAQVLQVTWQHHHLYPLRATYRWEQTDVTFLHHNGHVLLLVECKCY